MTAVEELEPIRSRLARLGRLHTPADVADAVSFLAGPARWVNGQTIYVNGGVI